MLIKAACFAGLAVCAATEAGAAPLTLWGAGSLSGALGTVAAAFTTATGIPVVTKFGPSGTLRQQIEAGARPDVFASADTSNPLALQAEGIAGSVTPFATNRVVAVAAAGVPVTSATLLPVLLDPAIKVGTSTPVADPLGDYTEQIFTQAGAVVPGAKAALDAKALRLVASPSSPVVPAGQNSVVHFIDGTHMADVFIAYTTTAVAALAIDPTLSVIQFPQGLGATGVDGLTVLDGADPWAAQLEGFILSPTGQAALAANGFGPASVPAPGSLIAMTVAGIAAVCRRNRDASPPGGRRSATRHGVGR